MTSPARSATQRSTTPAGGDAGTSLRDQTITGGTQLIFRQVAGLALRSIGLLLLIRLIGPGNYGIYAGSLAVATLFSSLCRLGSEVYLIRLRSEQVRAVEEQVFSFLVAMCAATLAIGLPAVLLIGRVIDTDGVLVLFVLLVLIPVNVLWVPAQARLERELRYRTLARIELTGDVVLYGIAIPVAAAGAGVWAPVCGYAAWQTWLLVASYRASGFTPRWRWERKLLAGLLRYGVTYSPSFWMTRLADVVNPVVVGRYVGSVGVGHVALALRLAENLGFVRRAINQMALPTLSRIQDDRARLQRAHAQAMMLKVLGVGIPLLAVTLTMPVLLPVVVGDEWGGVSQLFPLIAVAVVVSGPLTLNGKVLHVVGRNVPVIIAQTAHVALLGLLALALVPILGVDGFGWASIGSTLPLLVLDRAVRPVLTPKYGPAIRWCIALVPPMFVPLVSGPVAALLALPTVAVVLRRDSRRDLREVAALITRVRTRPTKQEVP